MKAIYIITTKINPCLSAYGL